MARVSTLAIIALGFALGCVRARAAAVPIEPSPSSPPTVWTERETLVGVTLEFRDAEWFDPARYADMKIGVAHGPSREDEAVRITDAIEDLGVGVHDTWSVDAQTWFEDGPQSCRDQVVFYSDEAAGLAAALQTRLPMSLAVTHDEGSSYDLIVQLCPRGGMGGPP